MEDKVPLTKTMEDYIETIFLLEKINKGARVSDIAEKLNIAKSTVHTALHALEDKGYINHEKYGKVTLTDMGVEKAAVIYETHKNLKKFFMQVLKLDEETSEKDACASEHILSEAAIKAISEMLN